MHSIFRPERDSQHISPTPLPSRHPHQFAAQNNRDSAVYQSLFRNLRHRWAPDAPAAQNDTSGCFARRIRSGSRVRENQLRSYSLYFFSCLCFAAVFAMYYQALRLPQCPRICTDSAKAPARLFKVHATTTTTRSGWSRLRVRVKARRAIRRKIVSLRLSASVFKAAV